MRSASRANVSAACGIGFALFFAVAVTPQVAWAQAAQTQPSSRVTIGGYLGLAHGSPVGDHLGATPDRDHIFVGLHGTASILRSDRWNFAFAPEVVPVLLVSDNPKYERVVSVYGNEGFRFAGDGYVYGFAVSPVGFELQRKVTTHVSVFGASAVGVVWFTRPTPTFGSRAFNYTAEWGGGVLWHTYERYALRLGYKFHHFSNAYSAPENPGVDGNVFLLGVERSFGS